MRNMRANQGRRRLHVRSGVMTRNALREQIFSGFARKADMPAALRTRCEMTQLMS